MLAKTLSAAMSGIDALPVEIEVNATEAAVGSRIFFKLVVDGLGLWTIGSPWSGMTILRTDFF